MSELQGWALVVVAGLVLLLHMILGFYLTENSDSIFWIIPVIEMVTVVISFIFMIIKIFGG